MDEVLTHPLRDAANKVYLMAKSAKEMDEEGKAAARVLVAPLIIDCQTEQIKALHEAAKTLADDLFLDAAKWMGMVGMSNEMMAGAVMSLLDEEEKITMAAEMLEGEAQLVMESGNERGVCEDCGQMHARVFVNEVEVEDLDALMAELPPDAQGAVSMALRTGHDVHLHHVTPEEFGKMMTDEEDGEG